MAEVAIANADWSITDDVRRALANATVEGEPVFAVVAVTTSAAQAAQCQLCRSPAAVVRYITMREDPAPEDVRGCCIALELILAVQADGSGFDESSRLEAVLRLKNAAANAVEAAPPGRAHAWGDVDRYHPRLRWGPPALDTAADQPWAVCRLPLEVGFILEDGTSH